MTKGVQFATKGSIRAQGARLSRRGFLRVWIAAALLLALSVSGMPAAAQGSPGTPQPPVVVSIEEFENVSTPAVAVFLDDYTGPPPLSMTYTADPAWISGPACNGLIASFNSGPGTTGCPASKYDTFIRPVAQALGNEFGGGDDNQAMADATVTGFPAPPTPAPTLQTVSPVLLPSPNRFIAFSIDVGVTECTTAPANPLLRFFLVDGMTEISVNDAAINPCTAPGGTTVPGGIRIGTFSTDGSILFAGSSIGVKLTNDQTSGKGNDYAVDNIRLLDATPQLDKAFATDFVEVGTPVALTFTITNTAELAAKEGWSFQDALPAGLSVADPTNAMTDCTNGVVTAAPGGGTIAVSGDLETGQAFCTTSVDVTSADPVSYENGPDDVFDLVGLDPPGTTEVTFVVTGLSLEKAGSAPNPVNVGDTVDYTFFVQNTSTVTVTNVTISDPLPGLSPIVCPVTTLAPGESMTCTATYTVTQADLDAGAIDNTATASAQPPGALPPVTAEDSETVVFLSVLEIPVLSRAGVLLLVLLLSAVAVWTLRRAGG